MKNKSTTPVASETDPQLHNEKKNHDPRKKSETHISRWIVGFNAWRSGIMSDFTFFICLTVIVGVLAGTMAYIFKILIHYVAHIFIPLIKADSLNWWIIPIPVAGIVATGIFTRYIIRTSLTHGVAQLIRNLRHKDYRLRHNLTFSPVIGGTITLGFGGSAGAEGPIAYTGAAIGSNIGQLLGLKPDMLKILTGCGAAAGISGIFMSPIGGLMFTLELLRMELTTLSVLGATLASLVAYGTVFIFHGCVYHASFTPPEPLSASLYPMVILLGIFCGLYALYYSSVMNGMDSLYKHISNPWIRNITGGVAVGGAIFLFPSLYGVGYPVISEIIHGNADAISNGSVLNLMNIGEWEPMVAATGILLLKCFATGSTNSSGGVAGDFAPTLFAGSMAGFLFASLCNSYLNTELPIGLFSFLGMAGVMAGAIEAPLMTIFIVLSLGLSYDFALPIAVSAFSSFLTVKAMSSLSGLDQKMVHHLKWFIQEHRSAGKAG